MKKLILSLVCMSLSLQAHAQSLYSWKSATAGGTWQTPADWSTVSGSGTTYPATGDTAELGNATSNRTVVYNNGSTTSPTEGTIGSLDFNQTTGGVTNELDVAFSLSVANAVTVSATNGTSEILLDAPSSGATAPFFVVANSLTIGNGGNVTFSGFSDLIGSENVGAVLETDSTVLNGGTLAIQAGNSGNPTVYTLTGALTMNSGNINFGGGIGTSTDNRLSTGNFTMNGGSINSNGVGSLYIYGTTNNITGGSLNNTPIFLENGPSGQSLTSSVALSNVTINAAAAGTSQVVIADTASGNNIGPVTMIQGNNGSSTTLQLGSDLKSAYQITAGTTGGPTTGSNSLGIDLAGHTLDLTASGTNFNPTNNGPSTAWTLASTTGQGTFKAAGFTLSSAASTTVGDNVTLLATGAGANDLGGSGTISQSSAFLYTGSGRATVISNRAVGGLQVQNGILQINQAAMTSAAVLVSNGGTLDLNGTAAGTLTLQSGNSFQVNGGTLALTLGTNSDQILGGAGGTFSLTNLTLDIDQASGFNVNDSYQLFSGFDSSASVDDIETNILGYDADISSTGVLTLQATPEPSMWLLLGFGFLLLVGAGRRRKSHELTAKV